MTRPYHLSVIKKHGTKSEAELAELREKYKDGVPEEVIDHVAEKITREFMGLNEQEVKVIE